jgi:diguanylate cyclase (GGDEF)-like protein
MLDGHTIYLVGFVSQAVFSLTLALLAFSDRRTRGTGWFAAGCCLELLMTSSRAILRSERDVIAASFGSCLLVLVFFFIYMGMRWFTVRRALQTRRVPIATSFAMTAVLAASFLVSVNAGLMLARLAAAGLMALMVPMLWNTRIAALRQMARYGAAVVSVLLVVLLARMALEQAAVTPLTSSLDDGGKLLTMLVATGLSFCFVGLYVAETQRRLHDETRVDVLTGLRNRRSMEEVVAREIHNAVHSGAPLSLLVIDVDHFKRLNDTWGHAIGDRALQKLGGTLQAVLEHDECIARLGGEEFAVLLPGLRMEEAAMVGEDIRREIEAMRIEDGRHAASVTASVGVSALRAGERNWIDMLRRADKALYRAKNDGRNRVSVWCERDGVRGHRSDSKLRAWRPWSSSTKSAQTDDTLLRQNAEVVN